MRRLFLFFITLAVWTTPLFSPAAAQNTDPAAKIPLFSQMAQKAADQGRIRVIVQLDVPDIESYRATSTQFKAGQSDAATIIRAASADGALAARIATTSDAVFNRIASQDVQVKRRFSTFPLMALEVSPEALSDLAQDPQVLHIMEDHLARPFLNNTANIIGASNNWASGITGDGWYVAILDTGIRSTHDMFGGKTIVEACYSSASHCPNAGTTMTGAGAAAHHDDVFRYGWDHGTHVAGIAAGNDGSLYGVARDADIIAVQVFSRFDTEGNCGVGQAPCVLAYNSDILAGLQYVYSIRASYNIAAVNLSLGGGEYTADCDVAYASMKTAVDDLDAAGIATVIASGNEDYCNAVGAPACISTAVTVGASTDADVMTSFSNYEDSLVDLFAPGASIYASVGDGDSDYESWSGTSMATPHVTGAFTLLRQADNTSSVTDMLTALDNEGAPVDDSINCGDSGTLPVPRIQVDDAVTVIITTPNTPDGLVVTPADGDQIDLTWNDNAVNEQGYKIERKTGAGGTYSQIATVGFNSTGYLDNTSLTELTTYYYRVRAYNSAGDSAYSAEANDSTPLMAPSSFSGTGVSQTQINLSWTDNSSAETGYLIERRIGSDPFVEVTTTAANAESYSDTGLTAGTTYDYIIRCTDGSNVSIDVQTSVSTLMTIPDAPDGLTATAADGDQIDLAWNDNADNEQGYKIERKTGAGGTYSEITTVAASTTSYSDSASLAELTTYYYQVRAYNGAGDSAYSAEANDSTSLMSPSGFTGTGVSQTQINLSWTDNSSAETGYLIERRIGSDPFVEVTTAAANAESYSDTGLTAGTTYDYRIRSTHGSSPSPWVQTVVSTRDAPTPPADDDGGGGGCFLSAIVQ